jgi:phage terminase large subunit-like protein
VIAVRQGRDIVKIMRHRGDDTMTVVGHVIEAIEEFKPTLVVIDEGGLGAGIVDRLKEQRYKIKGVNFGNKAKTRSCTATCGRRCGATCGSG